MAYNEFLADRIRSSLKQKRIGFEEKRMIGGLCFLVRNKMCLGIVKDNLMARIDPEIYNEALTKKGCSEMDFTGRPLKGFVFVDAIGTNMDADLNYWISLALKFNPKARSINK
ncbi:MAG: TfoX/Sxy family protein [Bacteroidales bacterium]|nr:TfoX/Sxy family protein [Bacteroidales bacterium]